MPDQADSVAAAPRTRVLFSTPRGRPRYRRATDVFVLSGAFLALAVTLLAYPPSGMERSLEALVDAVPGWLAPAWRLAYATIGLWAVVLVAAAALTRRHLIWLQALLAVAGTVVLAVASAWVAGGAWPDVDGLTTVRTDGQVYPLLRLAASAAVVLTVGPHLVRPLARCGPWIVTAGSVSALLVEDAPPSATAVSLLVAVVSAAAIRLLLGTSAGHPEIPDVVASLRDLGVHVARLERAQRLPAGVFVADGVLEDGSPIQVKVVGRDAYDTHLLEKGWRTLLYADDGPRVRRSRIEAVEHEALLALLARQGGVATHRVVLAAETPRGDALLVLAGAAVSFATLDPETFDPAMLAGCWQALGALAAAGIAHHAIDDEAVAVVDGAIGLVGLSRATTGAPQAHLDRDRAQLLATTASWAGVGAAADAACAALGPETMERLLAYIQPATFGPRLRRALRTAGVEIDELRAEAAARAGVDPPELVRLRRVTWWTAAQVALLALAVSAVLGALTGLDYELLRSYVADASVPWLVAGLVVAQLPRVTQALSTLGSVPPRLPFVPVYVMQLATSYMNLALPSSLARMAINIRFFQRQGIAPATAVTGGVIDSFISTVIQAVLLALLVLFSVSDLELDLDLPAAPSSTALAVTVAIGVAAVAAAAAVRRVRDAVTDRVRRWWPEVRAAIAALRTGHKLGLLVGGSLATELLFATALGMFANAFGFDLSLVDLLVVNISVSLLASFVPVPGGIGVAEFGLTVGLTAAGMPEEAALATALLYRVATFYLPPVWGFFAMRWLTRNKLL